MGAYFDAWRRYLNPSYEAGIEEAKSALLAGDISTAQLDELAGDLRPLKGWLETAVPDLPLAQRRQLAEGLVARDPETLSRPEWYLADQLRRTPDAAKE